MSGVPETKDMAAESSPSTIQNTEMKILQLNPLSGEQPSTELCSRIDDQNKNRVSSQIHSMNYIQQKNENNHSLISDVNEQVNGKDYDDDSHILGQASQAFEPSEDKKGFFLDPIVKALEEQCENRNKNTSLQESNQDENLELATNSSNMNLIAKTPFQKQWENLRNVSLQEFNQDEKTNFVLRQNSSVNPKLDNSSLSAPILTYISKKDTKSEAEESAIFQYYIKSIEKWLDKVDEVNLYNTVRLQALIGRIVDLKHLESVIKEKRNKLTIRQNRSLYNCKYISQALTLYERYLNQAYGEQSKLRIEYLNRSLQIARYPLEEMLFENRENTVNIINRATAKMKKVFLKLKEMDKDTERASFVFQSDVEKFFHDCEISSLR